MTYLDGELEWTPEALARLKKIPFFVRGKARQRIEELARERDCEQITVDLFDEAREEFGQ